MRQKLIVAVQMLGTLTVIAGVALIAPIGLTLIISGVLLTAVAISAEAGWI